MMSGSHSQRLVYVAEIGAFLPMICTVAIVLDFIPTLWIFDPKFFFLGFINKRLDFSSVENCLTFHAYQTMCSLFQNHSLWY